MTTKKYIGFGGTYPYHLVVDFVLEAQGAGTVVESNHPSIEVGYSNTSWGGAKEFWIDYGVTYKYVPTNEGDKETDI